MTTTITPSAAPASHRLRADLERLREEGDAAEAEIIRLRHLRPDVLRNGTDTEVERHDAETAKHRRTIERAEARTGVLKADLAAAQHAEDQGERRTAYEAAIGASAEAERVLREVYEPAADMIRQTLERVAELRAVVVAANDRRPEGSPFIPDVEAFRQPTFVPAHWHEEEETRWFDAEGNDVNPMHHRKPDGSFGPHIRARQVLVKRFVPGSVNVSRDPLGRTVNLPSLGSSEPDFWPVRP